jgi:hypothetical protein
MSGIIAKNANRSSGIIGPVAGSGGGTTNNSVDTMTGDGSDTTLALSVSPGSENNVQITFDGVTQHHSTFSLSGSTITFSTAPPTGVLVEAVSGTASTTGTPDDGTVSLAKMAVNSIDSDQYVDGSIDAVHMSANSVDSDAYVDASIDLAHIATNQIDETLMKDAFVGDFTDATVTASDYFIHGDATDSGNTKKDTVQGILDLASSTIVQVVNVSTGSATTTTTTFPADDTIGQNTEGAEFMTLAITPTSSSNKLIIIVSVGSTGNSSANNATCALFQDSTAGALAQVGQRFDNSNTPWQFWIGHYMAAGTTSSTTFKVRIGCSNAGTTTFNGWDGSRKHGGVSASSITIWEVAV